MPEMTMLAAINDALHVAMAKDDRVVATTGTSFERVYKDFGYKVTERFSP